MKVLHVGKYYPPYRGGMETVLQNVAEGLLDAGCEVSLLTAGDCSVDSREPIRGQETGNEGVLVRAAVQAVFRSQPVMTGLVGLLRREITLQRPDLVHLHLPNPLAAAAWLGLISTGLPHRPPLAAWYHADITRQRWGRQLLRPVIDTCLARAAGICVSSAALVERSPVLRRYQEKVTVIPFGINGEPWNEILPQRDGAFLFVGRLVPYKGVDVLLRALAQVPAADLVVVGDGPEREALLSLSRRLGVAGRVRFVGTLAEEGIAAQLATARALVLPSVDASEAFGLVQLEAMAAGVPVVVTDLPTGVPEVGVPEETGLLVPPRDVSALAGALRRLQSDGDLCRRLGEGGRRRFEARYLRRVMVRQLMTWYEAILGRSGDRREA